MRLSEMIDNRKHFFCDNYQYYNAHLYLPDENNKTDEELLNRHARTARPFGDDAFMYKPEVLTGEVSASETTDYICR